jgi:hypothetical protein
MAQELKIDIEKIIDDESSKGSVAHKVWLAGLGALTAGTEGGDKAFNALVEKGRKIESQVEEMIGRAVKSTEGEDWNLLIPNLFETFFKLWFDAVRKQGLIGGTQQSLHLSLDLAVAFWVMPRNIQSAFLKLIQTAQRTIDLTEDKKTIRCEVCEQNLATSREVKRLILNHLELTETALSLASKCPEELRLGHEWREEFSSELWEKLTERFSVEVVDLLDKVIAKGKDLFKYYEHDPVFVKDAAVFTEIVERYSTNVSKPPAFLGYDDPLFLLRLVAGTPASWSHNRRYSEIKTLQIDESESTQPWKGDTTGREQGERNQYIEDVWLGVGSTNIIALKQWQEDAWEKPQNSLEKIPENEIMQDKELWFYVNGIVTDHYIAQLNAEYLAELFRRRIHILHNETEGFYRDLQECIVGRVQNKETRAVVDVMKGLILATKAPILDKEEESHDMPKVVIIAHSQGTIIMARIVKALFEPGEVKTILEKVLLRSQVSDEIKKQVLAIIEMPDEQLEQRLNHLLKRLEIFNFAMCSDEFVKKEIPSKSKRFYPAVVEHFVNQHDLVASLAPQDRYGFAGTVFERAGAWGHFLNAHYLDGFKEGEYEGPGQVSRLVEYLDQARSGLAVHSLGREG